MGVTGERGSTRRASARRQAIEIYTPMRDENGAFTGLNHEAILYDPEALVEPVRIIRKLVKIAEYDDRNADPYATPSASRPSSRSRERPPP